MTNRQLVADALPFLVLGGMPFESAVQARGLRSLQQLASEPLEPFLKPKSARKLGDQLATTLVQPKDPLGADFRSTALLKLMPKLSDSLRNVEHGEVGSRMFNLLVERRSLAWPRVAGFSIQEVYGWRNAGVLSCRELFSAAVCEALRISGDGLGVLSPSLSQKTLDEQKEDRSTAEAQLIVSGSLVGIAAWASGERGVTGILEALELAKTDPDLPPEVADSLGRLAQLNPAVLAGGLREGYSPMAALDRTFDGLDERAVQVLASRALALSGRITLSDIAGRWRVTRERVRQVESKALRQLQTRAKQAGQGSLARTASRLRRALGSASPVSRLTELYPAFRSDPLGDRKALLVRVLLWLAGPYQLVDDWIVLKPISQVETDSERAVRQALSDGVAPVQQVQAALESVGIHPESTMAWLGRLRGFRTVESNVLEWSGTLADKVTRILTLAGEPLTREEISARVGESHGAGTLSNYLFSDERFVRVDLRRFGLASWDLEEYQDIVEEIADEIREAGGPVKLQDLVESLTAKFGVSPTSVRTYALNAFRFGRTAEGLIYVRDGPSRGGRRGGRPVETSKCFYRFKDRWLFRLIVTDDLMRGSGSSIPAAVADLVELPDEGFTELDWKGIEIRIAWGEMQLTMGSIRPALIQLGASVGDYVFMDFLRAGKLGFRLLPADEVGKASPLDQVVLLVGSAGAATDNGKRIAVAESIGLPRTANWAECRARLEGRGDTELAARLSSVAAGSGVSIAELIELVSDPTN